jgi:Na+/melibiose symporter-like transporter
MEQTTVSQESKGFYKLNWLQRIGFGSGDLAQNLIYQTICMYLLFFYTDIYGLNPGVAATMFLVVRLVDVLWDPLVGTYVDKHNPRWGKYRSYLVLAGLPLTVLAILCFWNGMEGQTETIKLIYAYVTYVGLSMLYTLINVPYGALNSSLTRDTDEITILTSVRMFMANVGGLCVSAGVPILVAMLAAAKDYNGVFHLGVAVADKPEGPFVPNADPIRKSYSIDPCVFKDDDGKIYCYFGGIWGGQLQWYKDNKALKDEHLPEGKENPLNTLADGSAI